jgi:hypothetical protein
VGTSKDPATSYKRGSYNYNWEHSQYLFEWKAVIASSQGTHALPEKEVIMPNQNSWPETVKWMGSKCAPKQKCQLKEHRLTAKSISVIKSKKCCMHTDPYVGGEQSGRHAKPDVISIAANQHACTALPSSPVVPLNMLTHTLVSMLGVTLPNIYTFISVSGVIPPNAYAFPLVPPFAACWESLSQMGLSPHFITFPWLLW